jgi:hypothetical protein
VETTQRETRRTFELRWIQIELRDFLACTLTVLRTVVVTRSPCSATPSTASILTGPYSNVE